MPAPWATVGVLTEDVGVGGIAYLEMPLGALERGMGLMSQVKEGLSDVTVPTLLVYGDADQVVDKANGPSLLRTSGRPTSACRLCLTPRTR